MRFFFGIIISINERTFHLSLFISLSHLANHFPNPFQFSSHFQSIEILANAIKIHTYIERLSEIDPAGFRLNVEVVEVLGVEGRGEGVADGAVVVRVLVGGRHAKDVRTDIRVLFHVLDVFLEKGKQILRYFSSCLWEKKQL